MLPIRTRVPVIRSQRVFAGWSNEFVANRHQVGIEPSPNSVGGIIENNDGSAYVGGI